MVHLAKFFFDLLLCRFLASAANERVETGVFKIEPKIELRKVRQIDLDLPVPKDC
jgi:hypothetical protein